jgi:hypothetical protein
MKNRRTFLLLLTTMVAALAVVAVPVLADELIGVLTKVDVEGKKVTIIEKDTDKEVEITVTGDTEYVSPKGASKIDLEKVSKRIERAKEKGQKGISVKVTHEKRVASKIESAKKQEAPKKDN